MRTTAGPYHLKNSTHSCFLLLGNFQVTSLTTGHIPPLSTSGRLNGKQLRKGCCCQVEPWLIICGYIDQAAGDVALPSCADLSPIAQ